MWFEVALQTLMVVFVIFAVKPKNIKDFFNKINLKKIDLFKLLASIGKYTTLLLVASVLIGLFFSWIGMAEDANLVKEIILKIPFYEALILIFFAGIAEEVLFRGYLVKKTNIWISTFLFAISHLGYGSVTEIFGAFALGLILAIQFQRTKNLWTVILTHMLYNLIILTAIFSVSL